MSGTVHYVTESEGPLERETARFAVEQGVLLIFDGDYMQPQQAYAPGSWSEVYVET